MNNSHRIAMAQSLLAELARAEVRYGWHGTHALRAFVLRAVSELLA